MNLNETVKIDVAIKQIKRKPRIATIIGLLILIVLLWFTLSILSGIGKVTQASKNSSPILKFFGHNLKPEDLKSEGDGRINILFIGIGGAGHKGGQLADTIMVVSIDPINNQLALLSLPRDLRVSIKGNGQNKINAAYAYGEQQKTGHGPELLKETVADILDLPIHYFIRVDFTGFIKLVDTVGGIQLDVPKAINDPFYPDENLIGYEPFYLKEGLQTLNGVTALKYARSRQTTSDFDRAKRQQMIVLGIKEKVFSINVLANPKKIAQILGIAGDHIRMDLTINEIQDLLKIIKKLDQENIITKVFDNSSDGPLKTINEGGYYLVPKDGSFKEIKRIAHEIFIDPYISKEGAKIEIVNASGLATVAEELIQDLKSRGYNIVKSSTITPEAESFIAQTSSKDITFTLKFLHERTQLPIKNIIAKDSEADIIIKLGKDFQP